MLSGIRTRFVFLAVKTSVQAVEWAEGEFPRLKEGGNAPYDTVASPKLPVHPWEDSLRDDFDGPTINKHFQTLREPHDESWLTLNRKPGWLSLKGRNSLYSRFDQSLIARRLQHFKAEAETCLTFDPKYPKQEAGLIAYYDRMNYHYLRVTTGKEGLLSIGVISSSNGGGCDGKIEVTDIATVPRGSSVYLKMVNDYADLSFAWSLDGEAWNLAGKVFDSTNMGDRASNISGFTGTFWGVCCQDMTGDEIWANFDYFEYKQIED